jgi:hypothetical protein
MVGKSVESGYDLLGIIVNLLFVAVIAIVVIVVGLRRLGGCECGGDLSCSLLIPLALICNTTFLLMWKMQS